MASHPTFDDLLTNNAAYAKTFAPNTHLEGIARAGVAILTCMDSRIEPLSLLGLGIGDVKILRTPGGQVTPDALNGLILAVNLLEVERIMVVPHTRCAMSGGDEALRDQMAAVGADARGLNFGGVPDQQAKLARDVALLRAEPLIAGRAEIGGFVYDVDTGRLTRQL